jgi:predicted metal-dependent peptidase
MTNTLPAKVSRGRIQLMLRHAYLASATARLRFRVVEEVWCPTMSTDGFNIFINPAFVDEITEEEVAGVMAHEVMHCILGHADRMGDRNPRLWNIAIDYATNLILSDAGVVLPKSGLLDWSFKGMTAEDIYKALLEKPKKEIEKLISQREGAVLSDTHLDPNDLRGQWARSQGHPTEAERRRLRKGWNDELKSKLPGKISGDHSSEIEKSGKQEIDWRAFLSRFMTGLRRDDYRIFPPNKKHLWRGIYLPSFGNPGPDHIVVAIDSSGSMDSQLLGKILTEIDAARQTADCRLTVIQCDAEIKNVETLEAWELTNVNFDRMKIRGRGGTSLIPPFDWISKYIEKGNPVPDALIYMTDGFGPSPKISPAFPCLWVVPENGAADFSFGNVVRVNAAA